MSECLSNDWKNLSTEELNSVLEEKHLEWDAWEAVEGVLARRKTISSEAYGNNFSSFLRTGVMNRID